MHVPDVDAEEPEAVGREHTSHAALLSMRVTTTLGA